MRKTLKSFVALLFMIILFSLSGCGPQAEERAESLVFPRKPLEMIIVWSEGGGTDRASRLIGEYASKELGQIFHYRNVTGANGATGWQEGAEALPDGYTVTNLTFDILTNQALDPNYTGYDDFDLLCLFTIQGIGVFVPEASPYMSLNELMAAGAEKPHQLTLATTPLGGFFHQGAALLEETTEGSRFNMSPYGGSAEIIAALDQGKVDAGIQTLTGMEPYLEKGSIRLLAVLTEKRLKNYPEVPTAREVGYDVVHKSWRGFGVPKGTPEEIKTVLVSAFEKAYENPEFQEKAEEAGLDLVFAGPTVFKATLDYQYPNVERILRELDFVK